MTTTRSSAAATLIRHVDGVEWPVPGSWAIRPGCPLDVRRVRLLRRRHRLVTSYHGSLLVAEHGLGSALHLVIGAVPALARGDIDLSATITDADRAGFLAARGHGSPR